MKLRAAPLHRTGALRNRVALERLARTEDGGGGGQLSWVQVDELWAAIRPYSGNEAVVAEVLMGRVSHLIVIRYRPDVTAAMRFRTSSRNLEIVAALDNDERKTWLDCYCVEKNL